MEIKHGVSWSTPRPKCINRIDGVGLQLNKVGRDLEGRLGVWKDGHFFFLATMEEPVQLLKEGNAYFLFQMDPTTLLQLSRESCNVKAAWRPKGASFRVREHEAPGFLEKASFPDAWRIRRSQADRWFGVEALDLSCSWDMDRVQPLYQIGGHSYSRESLLGGLSSQTVRLDNGQILRTDTQTILKNEQILAGIRELHEDVEAQRGLLRRILGESRSPRETPIPKYWLNRLRPYQRQGVAWLLANFHNGESSLLADDMGLGKTIQTLAFLDCVRKDQPQLIVAPTSLLHNWKEEAAKFCPSRQVLVHYGPKRSKQAEVLQKADLVITSYGTLRQDLDWLYDVSFQVAALDEAQAIKNPKSQTAQSVGELWADHRLALTGTPVENRMTELWSIFQFLAPNYLGDESEIKEITLPGSASYQALKMKVSPFVKRRLKQEVERDLPEKQEVVVKLELHPEQMAFYHGILKETRRDLETQKTNTLSILTKLLRLRQACCHPGLFDETQLTMASTKFDFLLDQLQEVVSANHSALIFSQFAKLLKLFQFRLEEKGMNALYLDGQTRNRQDLVHAFQRGDAPLFLISLKAGGTGLNLTRASYVYHLDPWWNPMAEAQATDRAHRIGQTQKVFSYKLIAEGTIEEKILALQTNKKFLADGLWADPEKLLAQMDRGTLMHLFG